MPEAEAPSRGHEPARPAERLRERRRKRLERLAGDSRPLPIGFALVGVQKAATSTLYRMLVQHPEIAAGPEKEMRFFDDESRDWTNPSYEEYKRPSTSSRSRLAGDATPSYFYWPQALERMHRYDPGMRLLLSVRDPIERALSQWSMLRGNDPEFPDVPDAIELWSSVGVYDHLPHGLTPFELRSRSLFARGLYGRQYERGVSLFGAESWCVVDFRSMIADPHPTLDRVTDCVGVPRFSVYPQLKHRNATRNDHRGRPPTPKDIDTLVRLYADDLTHFSRLSGLDVAHWPTARVAAGGLSVEDLTDSLVRKLGLPS